MKTSPTQRSLKLLRDDGWTCAITEHWNQFAHIRQDLFGFCDILCMSPTRGFMAVQTTSATNFSARVNKINAEPRAAIFRASGGKIVVHGWAKTGPRGKAKHWTCRVIAIADPITWREQEVFP